MARFFGRAEKDSAQVRPSDGDLFDEELQRRLEVLALVARRIYAGRQRAERRTRKTGSGIEFADHREYTPGDDFRYLDVNVLPAYGSPTAAPLRGRRGPQRLHHRRHISLHGDGPSP